MSFYSEMAEMATELITEFGTDVTITREIDKEIDPVTGDILVDAESIEYTAQGVMKKYPENLIDGTRITSSDRQLIIEASVVEPLIIDKITINNQDWPIIEIESVNPAGTPLIYILRVRR